MRPIREQQFGRYILESRIAMGGMAEVFKARLESDTFKKDVCIKCILPHFLSNDERVRSRFVDMFKQEAAISARLSHPNIVQVFDYGVVDERPFIAMEYVDGIDLKKTMAFYRQQETPIPYPFICQVIRSAAAGCYVAHRGVDDDFGSIVHRDVSPHNILLSRDGQIKMTDFGIAKSLGEATSTKTGLLKGKLRYLAPEQGKGEPVTVHTDQYALGIILWEMLTGRRLFDGRTDAEILYKTVHPEIERPSIYRSDIPEALDALTMKMLAFSPEARWPDLQVIIHQVNEVIDRAEYKQSELNIRSYLVPCLEHWVPQHTVIQPESAETKLELDVASTMTMKENIASSEVLTIASATELYVSESSLPVMLDKKNIETERVERTQSTSRSMWRLMISGAILGIGTLFLVRAFQSASTDTQPSIKPVAASMRLEASVEKPTPKPAVVIPEEVVKLPPPKELDDKTIDMVPEPIDSQNTLKEHVRLSKKAKVSTRDVRLSIDGDWAYVYKGKHKLGELPGQFKLPVGQHVLELRKPGKKSVRKTIYVKRSGENNFKLAF